MPTSRVLRDRAAMSGFRGQEVDRTKGGATLQFVNFAKDPGVIAPFKLYYGAGGSWHRYSRPSSTEI